MYVRKVPRKNTENIGVHIVESYRNDKGQPRQRIVVNMGSAPPGKPLEALLHLAEEEKKRREKEKNEGEKQLTLFPAEQLAGKVVESRNQERDDKELRVNLRNLREQKRLCVGYHEVLGKFYGQMGLDRLWESRHRMSQDLFRQAVIMRLASPGGGLGRSEALGRDHGVDVPAEKFCRMMDRVDEKRIEKLQRIVLGEVSSLLPEKTEVVFFDVMTLAVAGGEEEGWSGDGRPRGAQAVLGLFRTAEGLPLGYEMFPGNTADAGAFDAAIERLSRRMNPGRVVFVADAGVMSRENLEILEKKGYGWMAAAKLREMPKKSQDKIFAHERWEDHGEEGRAADMEIDGRRLVLRRCAKTARKDAMEEDAARKDEKFDGLCGVWTSLDKEKHSAAEVYACYAELRRTEQSFGVTEHAISAMPVFRWTERRVRAHTAVCFAAFAVLKLFCWKHNVRNSGQGKLSEDRVLAELGKVEMSLAQDLSDGREYLMPSEGTRTQRLLYATIGEKLCEETVPMVSG